MEWNGNMIEPASSRVYSHTLGPGYVALFKSIFKFTLIIVVVFRRILEALRAQSSQDGQCILLLPLNVSYSQSDPFTSLFVPPSIPIF